MAVVTVPRNVQHQRDVAEFFGEAVRAARRNRGWTQEDLAQRLGWHRTTVTLMENGDQRVHLDDALWLARELGLDLEAVTFHVRVPS